MGNWLNGKNSGPANTAAQSEASCSPCTLICKSTTIKGDIYSEIDVRIEGVLEGNIDTKGTLYVATGGRVVTESAVCCKADISGEISGILTARDILYIRPGGMVMGDIAVADMVVEQGGFFDGTSRKIKPVEQSASASGAAKPLPSGKNPLPEPQKVPAPQ